MQKLLQIAKFQYCKLVEDSQVDSIFIEQPVLLRKLNEKSEKTVFYLHLYFPYKNINSSNMTQ